LLHTEGWGMHETKSMIASMTLLASIQDRKHAQTHARRQERDRLTRHSVEGHNDFHMVGWSHVGNHLVGRCNTPKCNTWQNQCRNIIKCGPILGGIDVDSVAPQNSTES